MKTKFQLFICAALLVAAYSGYGQCNSAFTSLVYGGGVVYFQNSAYYNDTSGSGPRYYLWNFGDGSTDSTTLADDQHTYSTSGSYNVCLTVVDPSASCSNQTCDSVIINLCTDNVTFSPTAIGFGYDTFTTNLPSNFSFTGAWNFGDGNNASGTSASHQYTASGNYDVCFAVAGPGCADTICELLYINVCQSYNPGFTFNLVSSHPYIGVFLPAYPNPSSYTYSWLFPGNAWSDGDTLFYPLGANTSITMLVASPGGCTDSVTKTFNLDWCGLQPSITESSNGYTAWLAATVADTTLPGTTYTWITPGAGVDSVGSAYAAVTYPAYGTYYPYVIIAAQGGCTDTLGQPINITPGVYSIGGQISGGTANGNATVYLIIQDSIGHLALVDSELVQFIDTGTGGNTANYNFNNLAADTYYVKAALDSPNTAYADYLPTYYASSLSWSTATPVVITTANNYGVDFALKPGTNPGGPGFVAGYVSQGAGIVVHGNNNADGPRGVGDALAGVQVNLLTSADVAVAYTYTDANGGYRFNNLAYGSYKIYAEQLNKYPVPVPFTLSASDSGAQVNLDINSDSSYAGINNIGNISLQGIYPNPVVNKLEIQLSSQQNSGVIIKLSDALGRVVAAEETHLTTGINNLEMDMQNMAAGVYQLLIQTNYQHLTYKVLKAK